MLYQEVGERATKLDVGNLFPSQQILHLTRLCHKRKKTIIIPIIIVLSSKCNFFLLEQGISFTTDRRVVNTVKSHCSLEFAKSAAKQNKVAQALFKAYFEQGKDINSDDVLLQIAEETGLDKQGLKECLVAPQMHNNIKEEVRHAQIKGIHGVPFLRYMPMGLNDTNPISFSGAQGTELFVDVFNRVLAALKSKV